MPQKNKIAVAVLGATGSVGQKFIQLLDGHPFFEVTAVAASDRSAGKFYSDVVRWILPTPLPPAIAGMKIEECKPDLPTPLVFSGLDSSVAGEIESAFARAGYIVVSNSKNHRFDDNVPLLIPEVNAQHLELLKLQNYGAGKIVTNPNCSTIGLALALKPLQDAFGLEQVNVVTMQAISGAGFPGVASLSIVDNVIPYISGEEEKVETEPLKILGVLKGGELEFANIKISAQCNRVAVIDGHTGSVQIRLKKPATPKEIIGRWKSFTAEPQALRLPSAPLYPLHYFDQEDYPQPRLHRDLEKGMAVAIGRLRVCKIFDYKFTILSHNTARGAAGGAILCAELMKSRGLI
jgi:aspartate-semialdehyde dehydrogenase